MVNLRQAQNLAMAGLIVAMLMLVIPLVLSGYATENEWGGPRIADALEELHEGVGKVFLGVVLAHLGLLTIVSLMRRENYPLRMLSGHAPGAGVSPVKSNRVWLAVLLLAAVVGFGVWRGVG